MLISTTEEIVTSLSATEGLTDSTDHTLTTTMLHSETETLGDTTTDSTPGVADNQGNLSQTSVLVISVVAAFLIGVVIVILALIGFNTVRKRMRKKRVARRQTDMRMMPLRGKGVPNDMVISMCVLCK